MVGISDRLEAASIGVITAKEVELVIEVVVHIRDKD